MSLPNGPYNPAEVEKEILEFWLSNKFYKPEYNPKENRVMSKDEMVKDQREAWSLVCPPPNAYARPHIGNISGYAYQDMMARFQRMNGKKVLMLPGKDHAGLEGEGVFVREVLEKKGIYKFDLDREEFYKMIWEFNMENRAKALKDEMEIGLSADFDRDKFTLDPEIVQTVLSTFVEMYKEGMIYKGVRIINWDPKARSAIADNQCIREERDGKLYTIKYKLVGGESFKYYLPDEDGNFSEERYEERDYIEVATTRPETMFGDTAVAINPKDERYKDLHGRKVVIPLIERSIPVITSPRVLTDFGTGCLKITPAHSPDDFQIMNEWNASQFVANNEELKISYINVIGKDLKLVGPVPENVKGVKYNQALPIILEDLKNSDVFVGEESIKQNILRAERTGAIVEPIMSSQWFISIEKIREPVIEMVRSGEVRIHPKNMEDKFFFWMENLRDWAISRSLWWGYRMPVWYRGEIEERIDDQGVVETFVMVDGKMETLDPSNENHMRVQIDSPGEGWIQDENVLDTWFSSGQWPYSVLESEGLMDEFYPTDVMETGFDILENWVSRMMMFSWFKHKKVPFKDVYLHGLVLGKDGQKMSKSKGNLVDIDQARLDYGTDAIRMVYFYQNKAGASYSFSPDKLKNFKQFMNKVWNATKFVLMNSESLKDLNYEHKSDSELKLELSKEIYAHITELKKKITKNISDFEFGHATDSLYQEFWHTYCDIYIEKSKEYIKTPASGDELTAEAEEVLSTMIFALREYIKMLHPFMPFITERIWRELPRIDGDHKSLMYSNW